MYKKKQVQYKWRQFKIYFIKYDIETKLNKNISNYNNTLIHNLMYSFTFKYDGNQSF